MSSPASLPPVDSCAPSIGRKWIVALTGLILVGFVAGHLAGNLLVFARPGRAQCLCSLPPPLPSWRCHLDRPHASSSPRSRPTSISPFFSPAQNRAAARQQRYAVEVTQNASSGSKWMILQRPADPRLRRLPPPPLHRPGRRRLPASSPSIPRAVSTSTAC